MAFQLPVCGITDCPRQMKAKGLCGTHYERIRKRGTLQVTRRPPGEGTINVRGYREFERDGVTVLEHREVMERVLGRPLARHEHVHHIDRNPLNNAPENLMLVTNRTHKKQHVKYFRNETHKECPACRRVLPRTEFYPHTQKTPWRDPSSYACKACTREANKAYY